MIFAKKRPGGNFCIIPGCTNQASKDRAENIQRSYFSFPPKYTQQYKEWMRNNRLKRGDWEPCRWERICSDHFKGGYYLIYLFIWISRKIYEILVAEKYYKIFLIGKKSYEVGTDGYVPTIFPWTKNTEKRSTRTALKTLDNTIQCMTHPTTFEHIYYDQRPPSK